MEERKLKYRRKIHFITEKMETLTSLPPDFPMDAVLYRIQTSLESAMDLAAMVVKDLGESVSDDYHNLEVLMKKKLISESLGKRLKSYNGLRNAIVHKYNSFEEKEALRSLSELKKDLYEFLEVIEHVIKKISFAD